MAQRQIFYQYDAAGSRCWGWWWHICRWRPRRCPWCPGSGTLRYRAPRAGAVLLQTAPRMYPRHTWRTENLKFYGFEYIADSLIQRTYLKLKLDKDDICCTCPVLCVQCIRAGVLLPLPESSPGQVSCLQRWGTWSGSELDDCRMQWTWWSPAQTLPGKFQ